MGFNSDHASFKQLRAIIAERRSPIVFWIGAGVSADANLPSWHQLREKLSNAALEELVSWPPVEADLEESNLSKAEASNDLWGSFEKLQDILGLPSYKALIREALTPSNTVGIPKLHELIWSIPNVRGVVSLNIDGLEGRAHRSALTNEYVDEFHGKDISNHIHTFQRKKPFIARLHGSHADASSWVFTKKELSTLFSNPSYKTSIQSIFASYTVVFLGITADDAAAGGFLEEMTTMGMDTGEHFWISSKTDKATREWCNKAGLQRIPYDTSGEETHTDVISELFDNIMNFVSHDITPEPIKYSGVENAKIPEFSELKKLPEDEARFALNAHAKYILNHSANRTDTRAYQEFLKNYSPAIHQSWHISDVDEFNKFFGYTAIEKIHSGAFSSVWRVIKDSNQYALKIMQMDNLQKGPQIDSFRRGVSSQQLLRDSVDFDGIAEIVEAFEIPTSVIMEFVDGESLKSLSEKPAFNFWEDGLEIMKNVCLELVQAHRSQFGILHRDIRPANIMLPYYYYGDSATDHGFHKFQVKLLNYDLSWHKDATGKVVPVNAASAGYYAPELIEQPDSTRAKAATVDTYGIGMTIFSIASKTTPPPAGSNAQNWLEVINKIMPNRNSWFNACHNFIKRLILKCTRSDPVSRPLVADVETDLSDLLNVLNNSQEAAGGKFLAENLIYSLCEDNYDVSEDGHIFSRDLRGAKCYKVRYNEGPDKIYFNISYASTNDGSWSNIDKTWTKNLNSACEILKSGGWRVTEENYSNRVIMVGAEIEVSILQKGYSKFEYALQRAIHRLTTN